MGGEVLYSTASEWGGVLDLSGKGHGISTGWGSLVCMCMYVYACKYVYVCVCMQMYVIVCVCMGSCVILGGGLLCDSGRLLCVYVYICICEGEREIGSEGRRK